MQVIDTLAAQGRTFAIRHCANSGATALYPEMALDMVRPGLVLYGAGDLAAQLGLKPVMSLKTTVYAARNCEADTSISYGRTYQTPPLPAPACCPSAMPTVCSGACPTA